MSDLEEARAEVTQLREIIDSMGCAALLLNTSIAQLTKENAELLAAMRAACALGSLSPVLEALKRLGHTAESASAASTPSNAITDSIAAYRAIIASMETELGRACAEISKLKAHAVMIIHLEKENSAMEPVIKAAAAWAEDRASMDKERRLVEEVKAYFDRYGGV